jgi:ABC-2 type transport system permease protein
MTTIDSVDEGTMTRARWALSDGLLIARRNLTHVRHVPEKLIDVTLQPLLFVLLFAYVFGGSVKVPGGYHAYVVTGIFVQTLTFAVGGAGVAIAEDMANGMIQRFRSLPMARSGVLLGRTLADLATTLIGIAILAVAGLLVGWRIHTGVPDAVAGFALLVLYAYAISWLGVLLGLIVRSADAVMGVIFLVAFPLSFIANTFVSAQSMPQPLATIANYNPVSAMTAAIRELFGNPSVVQAHPVWPMAHPILAAVLWCVAILAVCVPLAVRRYGVVSSR